MKKLDSVLLWTPRVLAILFVLFLSLFALDAWGIEGTLWQKLGGFLIHLIPSLALAIVVVLAWKWEWVGGAAFISGGVYYILAVHGHWSWYLTIAGPAILVGVLFLFSWYNKHKQK